MTRPGQCFPGYTLRGELRALPFDVRFRALPRAVPHLVDGAVAARAEGHQVFHRVRSPGRTR